MKSATSIDMMGMDSLISPMKNNSYSTNFDIVPQMSYTYSCASSTSGLLKLESNSKLRDMGQIDKQNPEEINGRQMELQEVIEMQTKVKQTFIIFMHNQNVIQRNQERIEELGHRNKLKKNQCFHIKEMTAFNLRRVSKLKDKMKSRERSQEVAVLNKIERSKERTSALFEQIEQLKYQIKEQKKLQKQIQFLKIQKSLLGPVLPFNFSNHQFAYGNMSPYYQNNFSFMPSGRSKESPLTGRSDDRNRNMKAGHENAETPAFEPKRQSFGNNFQQINGQNLMQALNQIISPIAHAAQTSPMGNLKEEKMGQKQAKLNGKWENTWEQKEVLQILNESDGKKVKTVESNQIRNSENKKLKTGESNESDSQPTPQFLIKQTDRDTFSGYHNRISIGPAQESLIIRKHPNGVVQSKNVIRQPNSIYDQSKVNVDFDESSTSLSKFSLNKKQNNLSHDRASQIRERSFTTDKQKNSSNSSFQKVSFQEASTSQVICKPLGPPPQLQEKRLRKVTQQESQLFESNQNKNSKHSRVKPIHYQVQDVILDEQNLKKSEIMKSSKMGNKNDMTDSQKKQEKLKDSDLEHVKKVTEEESDEDDFMKVNLGAVSKISKQKEFSERNWKSIDLDQKQKQFTKGHHDELHSLGNFSMPAIVADTDFHDGSQQEREKEFKKKRSRKNSGTRFSMILQSNYEGSKSQQN